MQIAHWMTRSPLTVLPHEKLARAMALMESNHCRRLPVMENGAMIGILTERDIRAHSGYLDSTQVDAAMTSDPVSITPQTSVEDAARLMLEHKIGGLPIVGNGELVGIISTSDILRAFLSVLQATEQITSE
jgi:CBS domain-containing protein